MKKKRNSPEQIVKLLERGSEMIAAGKTVDVVAGELGISTATWYTWKKQYGEMDVKQLAKLKELESENALLKRLLATAEMDKAILKDIAEGNF